MRESAAYDMILDVGRAEGIQRTILHLGRRTLGEPDEAVRLALKQITDLDHLDRLSGRLLDAATWDELLQTP
jgi:hypothetical protein